MSTSREPKELLAGKSFHRLAQTFYEHGSTFLREQGVEKPSGRRGRADIFLLVEDERSFAALAEVKNTSWEPLAARGTLQRNVARQARQLWSYLDGIAELRRPDGTSHHVDLSNLERYAAMIFPTAPRPSIRAQVEDAFGEYGISVIWLDEPPPEDSEAFPAWEALIEG